MKAGLLKSYLKYSYKELLLSLAIIVLFSYLTHDLFFCIFYFLLGTGREYYHYDAKLEKIKRLKAKGLSEEDLKNIEFVKKWEETRLEGLWRYCIRDGGIITGAGISLLVSLLYFVFAPNAFKNIISDPGNMFRLIGYAYITGAAIGVILYRILWWYNEKRFISLTDPFNILFAAKKSLFNE